MSMMKLDVVRKQCWNEESLLALVDKYLEMTGQWTAFEEFLEREAAEENAEMVGEEPPTWKR